MISKGKLQNENWPALIDSNWSRLDQEVAMVLRDVSEKGGLHSVGGINESLGDLKDKMKTSFFKGTSGFCLGKSWLKHKPWFE